MKQNKIIPNGLLIFHNTRMGPEDGPWGWSELSQKAIVNFFSPRYFNALEAQSGYRQYFPHVFQTLQLTFQITAIVYQQMFNKIKVLDTTYLI